VTLIVLICVWYGQATLNDATLVFVTDVEKVLPEALLHPSEAMMFTW
jgi:hypothetical protein